MSYRTTVILNVVGTSPEDSGSDDNIVVHFDTNGDSLVDDMPNDIPVQDEDSDGGVIVVISDQVPKKEGYDFEGWTDEEGGDEAKYQPGDEIFVDTNQGDVILYPVWEPEVVIGEDDYIIHFRDDDCDGDENDGDYTAENMPEYIIVRDDDGDGDIVIVIPDQVPEKEGYDFEGWTDEEGGDEAKYQPGDEIQIDAEQTDIILYPVWEPEENTSNDSVIDIPDTGYITQISGGFQNDQNFASQMALYSGLFLIISLLVCLIIKIFHSHRYKDSSFKIKHFSIFNALSCVVFSLICGYCITSFNSNNNPTNATDYDFVVPETLELTCYLGDGYCARYLTAQMNTATDYGYSIYISAVDSTNFTSEDSDTPIQVISSDGSLRDNTWGLKNLTSDTSWRSIPEYIDENTDGYLIQQYTDTTIAGQKSYFTVGVETANDLAAGQYSLTLDFKVVPREKTAKAILGENGNLNFIYDFETYEVGDTYTDNLGETVIAAVYRVPVHYDDFVEDTTELANAEAYLDDDILSSPPPPDYLEFNYNANILSANIDDTFRDFKPTDTRDWFYYDTNLQRITNLDNLDVSNVTNMDWMFHLSDNLDITTLDIDEWDTSNVTSMEKMFYSAGSDLESDFYLDLQQWDTGNVTSMYEMFDRAGYKATTWSIDLSGWDTSNVTNMSEMFDRAGYKATTWSIDLSGWDTSNVTNMDHMFHDAGHNSTTWSIGAISGWNTSNVTNMYCMFYYAGRNSATWNIGDLGEWDTSNVVSMGNMFYYAGYNATTWNIGDISGWDTSNVIIMEDMFSYAGYNAAYSLNLSGWNVSNVTDHANFNAGVTTKITPPVWNS